MNNLPHEQFPSRREFKPEKTYSIPAKPDGTPIILPDGTTRVELILHYAERVGKWIATLRQVDPAVPIMHSMPKSTHEDPVECAENFFETSHQLTQVRNFKIEDWQEEK